MLYDDADRNSRAGSTLAQNNTVNDIVAKSIMVLDAAQANDVSVKTHAVAAENSLFYGYALEAIPKNGAFGKVQTYGRVKKVNVRQEGAQAVSIGDVMKINGAVNELIRSGPATGVNGQIVALETIPTGTGVVTIDVFIRSA